MSGEGVPVVGVPKLNNAKVAIVSAQWHMEICEALVDGAQRACKQADLAEVRLEWVPGSFELPLACRYLLAADYDAVIALGLVLRGQTPHFDFVCHGVTSGLMDLMVTLMKPVGFGVLTCDNLEQARARSGLPGSVEDKGFEAASAALQMIELGRRILQ
jgi:6,7-dimethyl-8-ribityllumazine synthase